MARPLIAGLLHLTIAAIGCTLGATLGCKRAAAVAAAADAGPPPAELEAAVCGGESAPGCTDRARAYFHDKGLPRSYAHAALERACDDGEPGACHELAVKLEGVDGPADYPRAAELFKKACDGALAQSCGALALLYGQGKPGIAVDYSTSADLSRRACDLGEARACAHLGALYYDGKAFPRDPKKSLQSFKEACDLGDGNACGRAGMMHYQGEGVPKDLSAALTFLEKACANGDSNGCMGAGATSQLLHEPEAATDFYQRACNGGLLQACQLIGKLATTGGAPPVRLQVGAQPR